MKRSVLVLVLLLVGVIIYAQLEEKAMVSPQYTKYLDEVQKGENKNLTAEGYGLGYIPSIVNPNFDGVYKKTAGQAKFAASYDLRTSGYVTSVKNQGSCGSCWTFATMGSIESRWKVLGLGTYDLSEDNLKNCHLYDWGPCDGGNFDIASAYLSTLQGPMSEADDPYSASSTTCPTGLNYVKYVSGSRYLPADMDILKQAIIDYGAIYTSMTWDDPSYNSSNKTYYYSGSGSNNHAILLAGWDDNKVTAGGTGVWIIKNSWGTSWGESGYFYISYNDAMVLGTNGYFPDNVDYDADSKLHYYDDLGWVTSRGSGNTAYGISKFVPTDNHRITKIGTYATSSDALITIDVYDSFNGTTLSGLLGSISAQTCTWPGYYTFDLPTPIDISSGNDFYVKVRWNTPGYNFPIPDEEVIGGYTTAATIQTAKCWRSYTGATWTAIGQGTSYAYDLCISAYVTDQGVVADAGSDQTICKGSSTTLTATGGGTYLWSTSVTTAAITVTPTATATYTVTVTNGGTASDNVVVTVNALPTANAGADQTICRGATATLTASGGTTYSWNTGATTAAINVSPTTATTYTVTATTGGCSGSDNIVVTVNPSPTANAGVDQTICRGTTTTLTASGGTTYSWSTGSTTAAITVSPTNTTTYIVTATNGGCTDDDLVVITVNALPTANAGVDQTICKGTTATLTASGGTTYSWNTGFTTAAINVSPTANITYTVTATTNGCSDDDVVIVAVNAVPTANAGVDQTICRGTAATLTVSGGITYSWNTGLTTAAISVSPTTTTTYTATATDNNGCTDDDAVIVTVNASPTANAGVDQTICMGTTVTLTASGGTIYSWNTGATTASINMSPTITTTYTVTATTNDCSDDDMVIVTVNAMPTANAGVDQTICRGTTATLTASGGTTYSWNTGATTTSINMSPTTTTTYTVTATTNGCSDDDVVIITVNAMPTANAGADQTICRGATVTLTVSGGTTYSWNTGATTTSINMSPTITTTYTVTATTNGCSDDDVVIVTVNAMPTANAGVDQTICRGTAVTLTVTGGTTYSWNTGMTSSSISVSPTNTTTYTVTASNYGCTDNDDVIITVNAMPTADAGVNCTICKGATALLTASGGTTYSWNTGVTTTNINVTPVNSTTYTVTATTNNCTDDDVVIVTVNPLPTANAGLDQTVCEGETTTLTAAGGVSYQWNTSETTQSIIVDTANTTSYVVTVTDNNDCMDNDSVVVFVETCTGIYDINKNISVSIFPNPADNVFNIYISGLKYDCDLELLNMDGQSVYIGNIPRTQFKGDTCLKKINVSGYTKGVYFLKITSGDIIKMKKVVIY